MRLLLAMSLPLAIVSVFPFGAIGYRVTEPSADQDRPYTAIVTLSPEQEEAAMRSARSAWQFDARADRQHRVRLPLGELPDDSDGGLIEVRTPDPEGLPLPRSDYQAPPWLPSCRAAAPVKIARKPEPETPAFSRDELLKAL